MDPLNFFLAKKVSSFRSPETGELEVPSSLPSLQASHCPSFYNSDQALGVPMTTYWPSFLIPTRNQESSNYLCYMARCLAERLTLTPEALHFNPNLEKREKKNLNKYSKTRTGIQNQTKMQVYRINTLCFSHFLCFLTMLIMCFYIYSIWVLDNQLIKEDT